jgi:hypothetical protein
LIYILYQEFLLLSIDKFKFIGFGFFTYIVSTFIIKPKNYIFWDTFFHEISHIIFALLTFAKPHKLVVTPDNPENGNNGYVGYSFKSSRFMDFVRSHLVSLAPYFFSPLAFAVIMIYWVVVPDDYLIGISVGVVTVNSLLFIFGFFYAYNIRTSFIQAKPYQSDFDDVGFKYGIIFVIFMQLLFLLFFSLIIFSTGDSFEFLFDFIIDFINDIDISDLRFEIKMLLYEYFDVLVEF